MKFVATIILLVKIDKCSLELKYVNLSHTVDSGH